jgi:hypothetical protein
MVQYSLPTYTERDRLEDGYLELEFQEPVNQYNDEVDRANEALTIISGTWSEMDWRDDQTCWVWLGKNKQEG